MKHYHKITMIALFCIVFGWGQASVDAYAPHVSTKNFSAIPLPLVKPDHCVRILSAQAAEQSYNRKAIAAVAIGLYIGLNVATLPDGYRHTKTLPLAHCTGRGVVSPLP